MYFPYFIAYILIGFAVAVPVFFWALKNNQFRDQDRARFLPLEPEDESQPVRVSRIHRYEILTLITLAVTGLGASAGVLIFAIMHGGQP